MKGNTDRQGIVGHMFDSPIIARFIGIKAFSWNGLISLRVELYGCYKGMYQNVTCTVQNGTWL